MLDAAEYGDKRLMRLGGTPDDAQWILRGRLSQVLGFSELSRAAYAKVSSRKDPELAVLIKRFMAAEKGRE